MKSTTYDIIASLVMVLLVILSVIIPLLFGIPQLCLPLLALTPLWILPQKMIVHILKNQEELREMLRKKEDKPD